MNWAPIWCGIVDSSLWDEPDHVVKIFLTMLALKGPDHIVRKSAYQLKHHSRKTEAEVLDALRILSEPDTRRMEQQEFDGRRIEMVEGGWLVLNGEKYRSMVQKEMKRARDVKSQANWRARQAGKPIPYPSIRAKRREPTPLEAKEIAKKLAASVDANKTAHIATEEWIRSEGMLEEPEELNGGDAP